MSRWYSLDNTAKIIPSMTTKINTNVFRLVCSLEENIDVKILNIALEKTLREFPMFLYQMKKGLFWHYLEKGNIKPQVEIDDKHPCSKIDNGLLSILSDKVIRELDIFDLTKSEYKLALKSVISRCFSVII